MLRLLGNPKSLCTGLTRRDLLHIGGLGAFGLTLQDAAALQQARGHEGNGDDRFGRAKSCILIYKYGSPPQRKRSTQRRWHRRDRGAEGDPTKSRASGGRPSAEDPRRSSTA
ncbi:MAG: hypothetical protein U0992_20410 [Planctomycetaceae bacterium]